MRLHILMIAACVWVANATSALDLNVATLGAVGDGVADNTIVLQKAFDEVAKSGGGTVNVPAGRYRINGNLSIPGGVTLQGSYTTVPNVTNEGWMNPNGSTLMAYAGRGKNEGEPFIKLAGDNAAIAGLVIIYPEWKREDVPPVPYPPAIASENTHNVSITNCNIVNPYEAIRLIRAHRHIIRNVYGYPSWRGLYIDECYDIGRIENMHFWPFGTVYDPNEAYSKWINVNGVAFEFARTDWQYVTNTFCFGYGVGYKFSASANGVCNGSFLSIGADSCRRAIMVEDASNIGLLITNGEFVGRWDSSDSACVEVGPKASAKVSLVNCSFWGPNDKCIWMRGKNSQLTASACNFLRWDIAKIDSPAIALEAGRAILQGNTFGEGEIDVLVGKDVSSAILTGNQARPGLTVINKAGRRTVSYANEMPPVNMTPAQRAYYKINIGSGSDEQFVRRWQGAEQAHQWNMQGNSRWSTKDSKLILPLTPGKKYTLTIEVFIPEFALRPGAGLYLGNRQIVKFAKAGRAALTGTIAPQNTEKITLDIRCKEWIPKEHQPGNLDTRVLGVAVRSVTMKAAGATAKRPFVVN